MKKRFLSMLTVISMLAAFVVMPSVSADTGIKLGDYVQMGTYYGEPILWRCVSFEKISGYDSDGNPIIDSTDTVMECQDGYLPLMLSDKILCIKVFDTSGSDTNGSHGWDSNRKAWGSNYWGDSNMRSWLNSNAKEGDVLWLCGNPPSEAAVWQGYNDYADESGFLTNFTQDELNIISSVTQKSIVALPEYQNGIYASGTEKHQWDISIDNVVANYDTSYSEQVNDTIFLLDVKQVNTVYNNSVILGDNYYVGEPTEQCIKNSEYKHPLLITGYKWNYWLRSPYADSTGDTRCISSDGTVRGSDLYYCTSAYYEDIGVRPAFFLSDTAAFTGGKGTDDNPYVVDGSGKAVENIPSNATEYNGHSYCVYDSSVTWHEAEAACELLGGHLVTITSAEEQAFIETLLENGAKKQYWIGLTSDGNPQWVTGEEFSYSNWDELEPNSLSRTDGEKECYVHIFNVASPLRIGSQRFKWNDIYYDNTAPGDEDSFSLQTVGYICEWDNEIKIYLNSKRLTFDQQPVNQDGNLLVPIRAIGEAMGKTVLWSDEYNAAFIDNTDNALVIPIGETTLYLGSEQAYSTWEQKKTLVPSQILNGRTLVPIRQFAEALGAEVDWVGEENAAYIRYNNMVSDAMTDDLFDAVNLNYYIGHYSRNPFETYNELAIEPFYADRNPNIDAVAMGMSKPWSVINELISLFYGNTNASNIIQQTLYDVIGEIDDTAEISSVDTSILTDLVSYEKAGIKIYNEANGFDKDFLEAHPDLKSLNDGIGNVSTALDWFIFTMDELAYILTNYSVNISYLNAFEEAMASSGELDYNIQEAINDLRSQYTDKFLEVLVDLQEELTNNTFSTAMSIATGGAFSLGKLVWKTVFSITGVTKKGEALKTFYGIYCYNGGLDSAFDSTMKSSKDSVDLSNVKALIQLEKATKKTAIESIEDTMHFWQGEAKDLAQTYINQLDSWSYYIWERGISSDGSSGGGGSSW